MGHSDKTHFREMSTTETNHSQGDFVFPNGDEYSGGYISGENGIQMSGYGTWTSKQGYVYEGNWQNDRMEGQGRLSMPDGSVFEGQFQNGKFHVMVYIVGLMDQNMKVPSKKIG